MSIIYRKSVKGVEEVAFKLSGLPMRLTSYLLAVDGESNVDQLTARHPNLPSLGLVLQGLVEQGFFGGGRDIRKWGRQALDARRKQHTAFRRGCISHRSKLLPASPGAANTDPQPGIRARQVQGQHGSGYFDLARHGRCAGDSENTGLQQPG